MSDRTREEPPPIPEAPPAADDAPDPTASVDDSPQPTADAAPPADEASNPDEGSEAAAPEGAPAPSAAEAGAEAEETAEEGAVPERAEAVEPSAEASADDAPDPTATVDDAPEPSASTDVPERAADAEPPADEAPEPLTDASGSADDAPDPAADGPESAEAGAEAEEEAVPERAEAAESSAEASADDAPDPTATADDASEQAAPADETSESADEARESPEDVSEDDAPDPAASVDDAPEPKAQDAQDLTASAESEAESAEASKAEAPRVAEDEAEQYDNQALRDGPHYQEELDNQLAARGLDASEHDKLRLSRTNELSDAQAREVVGVRDTIKLDEGRMVTKVIPPETMQAYLKNATKLGKYDFNPGEFRGCIARGCDTADLRSMDQLRDGLALDDGGAGWSAVPQGASEAYQLRFPAPHDIRAAPSFGAVGDQGRANHVADMAGLGEGQVMGDPFLGTGYTGGGVPEWTAEPTGLPHHAEIWRMHADGTEGAIGFFDKNEGLWKKI